MRRLDEHYCFYWSAVITPPSPVIPQSSCCSCLWAKNEISLCRAVRWELFPDTRLSQVHSQETEAIQRLDILSRSGKGR
jgi:hypothetical protein